MTLKFKNELEEAYFLLTAHVMALHLIVAHFMRTGWSVVNHFYAK